MPLAHGSTGHLEGLGRDPDDVVQEEELLPVIEAWPHEGFYGPLLKISYEILLEPTKEPAKECNAKIS